MNGKLRRRLALGLVLLLLPSAVAAERFRVLDAALSMLEEGNPFLVRYNGQTGAGVIARYPLGCPYFWGGRNVRKILSPASPGQNSEYYKKGRQYLYGLDCVGLTRWVVVQAGFEAHPKISLLLNRTMFKEYANYKAGRVTGEERSAALAVGDLMAVQHSAGSFHIAMYCGTLADYGYTAGTLPGALSPYLYYPLVIQSTGSSDYYERYRSWLESQGKTDLLPPFGGVIVTILDVPLSAADSRTPDALGLGAPCFDLEGYHLQITDLSAEKRVRWIRWRKRPD